MSFKKYKLKECGSLVIINLNNVCSYRPLNIGVDSCPEVRTVDGNILILDINFTDFENTPDVKPLD